MEAKHYFYYKMSIVAAGTIIAVALIVTDKIAYLPMLGAPFIIVMLFT